MTYVLRMLSRVEVNLGSAADMKNTNGMIKTAESRASLSSYDWEKNFFSLLSGISVIRSQGGHSSCWNGWLTHFHPFC
jgi:hypothetical protein